MYAFGRKSDSHSGTQFSFTATRQGLMRQKNVVPDACGCASEQRQQCHITPLQNDCLFIDMQLYSLTNFPKPPYSGRARRSPFPGDDNKQNRVIRGSRGSHRTIDWHVFDFLSHEPVSPFSLLSSESEIWQRSGVRSLLCGWRSHLLRRATLLSLSPLSLLPVSNPILNCYNSKLYPIFKQPISFFCSNFTRNTGQQTVVED